MNKLLSILLFAVNPTQLKPMENPFLEDLWETDEGFIARAREKCALVVEKNLAAEQSEVGWWNMPQFISFWQDPAISLEYTGRTDRSDIIALRDQNNRPELSSVLNEFNSLLDQSMLFNHNDVRYVSLSRDACFLALLKNPTINLFSGPRENTIEVYNLADALWVKKWDGTYSPVLSNPNKIKVPDSFSCIAGIEFNNQNTKIALFGRDSTQCPGGLTVQKSSTDHHLVFKLGSTEKIK